MTLYAMVRGLPHLYVVTGDANFGGKCPSAKLCFGWRDGWYEPTKNLRIGTLAEWKEAAANEPDVARALGEIR